MSDKILCLSQSGIILYSGEHIRGTCQLQMVIAGYIYNYEHVITQWLKTMEHVVRA